VVEALNLAVSIAPSSLYSSSTIHLFSHSTQLFQRDNPILCAQMECMHAGSTQELAPMDPISLGLADFESSSDVNPDIAIYPQSDNNQRTQSNNTPSRDNQQNRDTPEYTGAQSDSMAAAVASMAESGNDNVRQADTATNVDSPRTEQQRRDQLQSMIMEQEDRIRHQQQMLEEYERRYATQPASEHDESQVDDREGE
jgi:hypothetical protein